MRDSIMSMTGTIVVTNNNVHFYDSLAQDEKSWISHLKGGESASIYSCDMSVACIQRLQRNITILPENLMQVKLNNN
ncbi:conjugative relaxosome accessory transposon family protein [Orientia tsutsugamushi str. TA763]|nr:conjugative relaxosome accessory transposon family protein [Orientia tsutsugamushi str. TA763]